VPTEGKAHGKHLFEGEGTTMEKSPELVCADDEVTRCVLLTLSERIGPQRFNAWFKHGTRIDVEESIVKISVPNPFVANWIENHYREEIGRAASDNTGKKRPVVVTIDPSLTREIRKRDLDSQADIVARTTQGRTRYKPTTRACPLRHKLEDFVVGQCNRLARSAAATVATANKPVFNPLFVHGPCGVGKTHLLQGICNLASKKLRGGRPVAWRYVTGEQFTNEFIQSLRNKKLGQFRARYRRLDLLAIDDVHFLAAKKATQDEFLHTFNSIESAGKQVVMASDAHPHLVGQFNPQLVSRFVAGMVVKIDPPDRDTRMAILRMRARRMKLAAGEKVLEYIAMHIRGSVRELEGALIKLAALTELAGGTVSLSLATEAMSDYLTRTDSALTLGDIEATVATYFGITPADIHSSRRTRTVSVARMIVMYLARKHTRMSYPEIARAIGKHHSSVVLGVQRMESLIAEGKELRWKTPAGPKTMAATRLVELLTRQFS